MDLPQKRIVSKDPGLMTSEELLAANGGRRRTLEQIIAQRAYNERKRSPSAYIAETKANVRWFLDHAGAKITVSTVL